MTNRIENIRLRDIDIDLYKYVDVDTNKRKFLKLQVTLSQNGEKAQTTTRFVVTASNVEPLYHTDINDAIRDYNSINL